MNVRNTSKVYLVGAGPGDPELLTVKAVKILSQADVIITDRLVSNAIIEEYAHPDALIYAVGKQGGSNASVPQHEINELIVKLAQKHKTVVRLKGGDIALFSNVLDELQALRDHNISYEIVPGITAASGASAYTGVPLTARGFAQGVKILTYYTNSAIEESSWKELATFEDTLVFYMSGKALHTVTGKLLDAGADASIPFIVVEQATTPEQYVFQSNLSEFFNNGFDITFKSPSLVIMGRVTELYDRFAWLPNNSKREHYFKPLNNYPELIQLVNDFQNEANVSRA
jgi:uroporphyrin-III C-methyltransferase